jgi:putative ABC transport system permease protein
MPPPDLKLATDLFVLLMLALPALKSRHGRAPVRATIRG